MRYYKNKIYLYIYINIDFCNEKYYCYTFYDKILQKEKYIFYIIYTTIFSLSYIFYNKKNQ